MNDGQMEQISSDNEIKTGKRDTVIWYWGNNLKKGFIGTVFMKKVIKVLKILMILTIAIVISGLVFPTWTPPIKGYPDSISILKQVEINGTKQEIMIRGCNKNNPVIIFVHGGPGCPEIPYVTQYQDLLEKNFTVVQYDQRGAGKSYHFFEDYSDLSADLLAEDLIALTEYISHQLETDEILLIGHSFGTVIGMKAAYKAPQKYLAYIGIGQVGDFWKGELEALEYCLEQAREENNENDRKAIENCREGILTKKESFPRAYIRKYNDAARLINENTDIIKGLLFHPEYNLLDVIRYGIGLKVSNDALWKEQKSTDLPQTVNVLKIPCYFMTGKYDYLTPAQSAKEYLDYIAAPYKEFILFERSGHYPQFEEKPEFAKIINDIYTKVSAGHQSND